MFWNPSLKNPNNSNEIGATYNNFNCSEIHNVFQFLKYKQEKPCHAKRYFSLSIEYNILLLKNILVFKAVKWVKYEYALKKWGWKVLNQNSYNTFLHHLRDMLSKIVKGGFFLSYHNWTWRTLYSHVSIRRGHT